MRKPVRLYFKAEPVIKTIKELTYVQRDILCLIVAFKDKGLRVLNPVISEGLLLSESYVGKVINRLEKTGYIRIEKAQSPHRVLYWSKKTKALLCTTVPSGNESTQHPSAKLLSTPVQSTQHPSAKCIVSKEGNKVNKGEKPVCSDKNFSAQSSRTPQENNAFEKFWKAYPKKVAKKDALKAWQKIAPDQRLFEKVMSALEIHKQQHSRIKDAGKFVPNPATWLNAERWNDELVEPDFSTREVSEAEAEQFMQEVERDN